jgi:hypothetical protein
MKKCRTCKIKYPEEILYFDECGICGLERSNNTLGVDRKKFDGEIAEDFRLQAIKWRKHLSKLEELKGRENK